MDGYTSVHLQNILQNIIPSYEWQQQQQHQTTIRHNLTTSTMPYQTPPHHTKPKKQNNRIGQASSSHAKLKAKHWHENIVKRAAVFTVRACVCVHVCPRDENYVKYSLETKIVYSIFVIARRISHTYTHK